MNTNTSPLRQYHHNTEMVMQHAWALVELLDHDAHNQRDIALCATALRKAVRAHRETMQELASTWKSRYPHHRVMRQGLL